jgi:hypothetical protein
LLYWHNLSLLALLARELVVAQDGRAFISGLQVLSLLAVRVQKYQY